MPLLLEDIIYVIKGTSQYSENVLFLMRVQDHETCLSHEFLSCKHELMVNHPSGLLLEQTAVGMNLDRL